MRHLHTIAVILGLACAGAGCSPTAGTRDATLQQPGASTAFLTYEAEAGSSDGETVHAEPLPAPDVVTPALEASGRAYVELARPGSHLDVVTTRAANALVVRTCIPDAATGGGTDATISLYVNGVFRQKLALTSRYAWTYGPNNGHANDPAAGHPHVFWDESRAFITGGIAAGDTLRLQKDAGDEAAYYRIDLVDLEEVAPPLPQPAGSLAATDFGAEANDDGDDTIALQTCIDAAKTQGKTVWIPPGRFLQSAKLRIDGVEVRGAGMWYTTLAGTVAGDNWDGRVGVTLAGLRPALRDLSITSLVHDSRRVKGGKPVTAKPGNCHGWAVENIWISHTNVGLWMSGADDGVVRGCRIRLTYADGINLNCGSSRNIIEQCHVRGCGDDGIAVLSEIKPKSGPSIGNIVRNNTVSAIWWGHNCDLAGGSGHLIEDNLFVDNALLGCFAINLPGAYPMTPLTSSVIRRNTILRGGGNGHGQKRGAVWIYAGSTTIDDVTFSDNRIIDAVFRGIHLAGSGVQYMTFARNLIEHPGEDGVVIQPEVRGSGVFQGNACTGLGTGRMDMVKPSGDGYTIQNLAP
jgi:hypothetical protein